MKKIYLFIGLALSMLAVSCDPTPAPEPDVPGDKTDVTVSVTATIATEGLLWSDGVTVAVNGVESSIVAGGEAVATFDVKNVNAPLKVVSPFEAYAVGDEVTVPDTQKYVAGGYDAAAFVLYGYTETVSAVEGEENKAVAEVGMTPVCGIIDLPVVIAEGSAAISTISLTAANEEAVAGTWKLDFAKGTKAAEKVYTSVEIACGETGVALGASPVDFRFVVPAATYAKGFIVEAATTDGHKFVIDYTGAIAVEAGLETVLDTMNFELIEKADATLNITIAEPAITWAAGDAVVVNGVLSSVVADANVGKSTASFDLQSVAYPYTVLYPSDLYTTNGRLRFYDEQRLLKNEIDREALAMVGYSFNSEVTLHNVCGIIKIPVTNNFENDVITLTKICLKSNDGSALAGKYNINYRNATISQVSAVDVLSLVPEEGSKGLAIAVGETVNVYAVIPEGKFPQGLTVDVYTNLGDQTGIQCAPAGGLNITRGVEFALDAVEYSDVKIDAISTVDEFTSLIGAINKGRTDRFKSESGEIVLANDIDLAGVEVPQLTGLDGAGLVDVINGQGFALKNIAVADALIAANSGTLKNIVFENCTMKNFVDKNAGTLEGITLNNCSSTGAFIANNAGVVENVTVNTYSLGANEFMTNPAEGTVKNLVLDGVTMPLNFMATNYGKIDGITVKNCSMNEAFILTNAADAVAGGIVMEANNTVEFPLPAAAYDFGFIVSKNAGTVEKCSNAIVYDKTWASLPGADCNFGGVVGVNTGLVSECSFNGTFKVSVTAPTKSRFHTFGGVVGNVNGKKDVVMVKDCTNSGLVEVTFKTQVYFQVGGVVGGTPSAKQCPGDYGIIDGCENTGNVGMIYIDGGSGAYPCCGGVCGYIEGYIQNCTNRGNTYLECKSTSATWTCAKHGGVAGVVTMGANNCHNYGQVNVVAGLFAGGTAGNRGAANGSCSNWAGVIAAAGPYTANSSIKFENCTNNADLSFQPGTTAGSPNFVYGGVFGYLTGSADNCVNNGSVSVYGGSYVIQFGGVAGYCDGNVTNCKNTARLYCDDSNYVNTTDAGANNRHYVGLGGIAGRAAVTKVNITISGCENSGELALSDGWETSTYTTGIGGIYGLSDKGTVTAENNTNTGTITAPAFDNIKKGNIAGTDGDL